MQTDQATASAMSSQETTAELRQGVVQLARRLRAEGGSQGLSSNKLSVLGHLHRNGPSSAGAVAALEHQQPQSLTRVFAELEQDGLITRAASEDDRRRVVLRITRDGQRALARDVAAWDAWLASALGGLTDTEREVLRLAGRLMSRLADAR